MYQKKIIAMAVAHACLIIGHQYHLKKRLEEMAAQGKLEGFIPKEAQ